MSPTDEDVATELAEPTEETEPELAPEPDVSPISEALPVRQRWIVIGGATAVVALLAFSVFTFVQWRRAEDRADSLAAARQDRREAASTAGAFGQALLSYDHADLGAARQRVLALATDSFATTYDEAFVAGLEPLITQLEAVAEATVQDVYVTELSGDSAKAVVVLDSEVHSTSGTRRLLGTYLQMNLVREGGEWKIDGVTAVSAVDESLTPPAGETTTTTAAPSG